MSQSIIGDFHFPVMTVGKLFTDNMLLLSNSIIWQSGKRLQHSVTGKVTAGLVERIAPCY